MTDLVETDVVTCFLRSGGDVLLLLRSEKVRTYAGRWGAVAGHVESDPETSAFREIEEETGFDDVTLVREGEPLPVIDQELGKKWIVHPFLFDAARRDPSLNWESLAFEWASPTEILRREVVPMLWDSYRAVAPTIEAVRDDRTNGSAYISPRALEVLRDRAAAGASWSELAYLAVELIESRPSMAALRNRVNRVMHAASDAAEIENIAHAEIGSAVENDRKAALSAAGLARGKVVLTLSRSGTVTEALLESRPVVFVAESRPGLEGRAVAEELGRRGLDVTLAADAALAALPDFDLVLVGADTLLPDGSLINKVGTHVAALVARERMKPFYAVTSLDKILASGEPQLKEDAGEAPPPLRAFGPVFEITAPRLVDGFVTEEGILAPSEIRRFSESLNRLGDWRRD